MLLHIVSGTILRIWQADEIILRHLRQVQIGVIWTKGIAKSRFLRNENHRLLRRNLIIQLEGIMMNRWLVIMLRKRNGRMISLVHRLFRSKVKVVWGIVIEMQRILKLFFQGFKRLVLGFIYFLWEELIVICQILIHFATHNLLSKVWFYNIHPLIQIPASGLIYSLTTCKLRFYWN